MNIFYLDPDPRVAAEYHCDKHVVKMIVESIQMLSNPYYTQHNITNLKNLTKNDIENIENTWKTLPREKPYRISFIHHPSSKWVMASSQHWEWLLCLAIELSFQYFSRYEKPHSCYNKLLWMKANPPKMEDNGFTQPPQAMPEKYKSPDSVASYQAYYVGEKSGFATWKNKQPNWYTIYK